MVLRALEFSDCISDSPWFRQNLHDHEQALDDAYKNIKNIEIQCRDLLACTRKLSLAQKSFAKSLTEFKIETVGTNQTDDERVIATCLKEFGKLINQVEEERMKLLNQAEYQYLEPLKKFRTEAIGKTLGEEKRKYEKESNKFYASLEKHLHLSTVRKNDFREADAQLDMQQHNFCKASLQYVTEIQSVQERMKFEFVETLSSFLYSMLTFYHVGHVIHEDFKPFLDNVQVKVQKTRESYTATITEAEGLKDKILKSHTKLAGASSNMFIEKPTSNIKQGYVYMQEKSKIPKTIGRDVLGKWSKYYCVYSKETRIFTMISVNTAAKTDMKSALGQSVAFKLKGCAKRSSDSIDKRFCFDVVADSRSDVMTFQALSEEDLREWIDAMNSSNKTSVFSAKTNPSCSTFQQTQLDEIGFEFVQQCVASLEERGIREQGVYRNCGVTSKVQKLMQLGLDRRKNSDKSLNWNDDEWETKTISSAVKTFLRNLPEPLMTFELHSVFINAAKMNEARTRVDHIHYYVHQLPPDHKRMLEIVIRHLRHVADLCDANLMTVGNLGVCFGPTLLRPKEETMAAIMDIKFCNVVVEVLIANFDKIFNMSPPNSVGPSPPKPDHHSSEQHERLIDADRPAIEVIVPQRVGIFGTNSYPSPARAVRTQSPKELPTPKVLKSSQNVSVSTNSSHPDDSRLVQLASTSGVSPATSPSAGKHLYAEEYDAARKCRTRDSSDSLNSLASAGSTTEDAHDPYIAVNKERAKNRLNSSYAPTYSRLTCESADGATCDGAHISSFAFSSMLKPTLFMQPSRRVKTLYACTPDHDSELSFEPGQIITNVYESKEEGWLVGTLNGKTGLIPSNYVEPLP